jgi:hypothetical protein
MALNTAQVPEPGKKEESATFSFKHLASLAHPAPTHRIQQETEPSIPWAILLIPAIYIFPIICHSVWNSMIWVSL